MKDFFYTRRGGHASGQEAKVGAWSPAQPLLTIEPGVKLVVRDRSLWTLGAEIFL